MAAELCSLKAVEAQLERKANEAAYTDKKNQISLIKATKESKEL